MSSSEAKLLSVGDLNPTVAAQAVGNFGAAVPNMGNASDLYELSKLFREDDGTDSKESKYLKAAAAEDAKYYAMAATMLHGNPAAAGVGRSADDIKTIKEKRDRIIYMLGGKGPEQVKAFGEILKAQSSRKDFENLFLPFVSPLTKIEAGKAFI